MKKAEYDIKYAESMIKKAEQNSSYCSFSSSETSPLLLYYYIILYRHEGYFSPEIRKKIKVSSCISGEKAEHTKISITMENVQNDDWRMMKSF